MHIKSSTSTTSPIIILVIIVVLLCAGTFIQHSSILSPLKSATAVIEQKRFSSSGSNKRPVIPYTTNQHLTPFHTTSLPPTPEFNIPEACKQVDFHWLASDRTFWDGWVSKSMFMRRDGKYTRKNVSIQQGESICITLLVGPVPAFSSIKSTSHYAPSDSIVMTAKSVSTGILMPITLQQDDKQSNAYFASVQFNHHDIYILETSVEYRSYFWELPHLHPYLPNKFTSRNRLTVYKSPHNSNRQLNSTTTEECNLYKNSQQLKDSVWMDKSHYQQVDPIGFYNSDFYSMNSDLVFIPKCKLKSVSATFNSHLKKTIHVLGDQYLKRNLEFLKGDISTTDLCNKVDQDEIDLSLIAPESDIYFNQVDSIPTIQKALAALSQETSKADIVILGIGNQDVSNTRQTPEEFALVFNAFLNYLTQQVYTENELIIVKTTQYYGSHLPYRGWTHGRSDAFANIIRSSVKQQSSKRVLLWDTHQIGLNENQVYCHDKTMSNSDVIKVENAMLSNIIRSAAYLYKL